MLKRYVIEKDFMMKTRDISKDKGVKLFTTFGWEVTTILVPDYEKTNIQFAHLICDTIISKARELGEITKIELKPQKWYNYVKFTKEGFIWKEQKSKKFLKTKKI